jgi:hypothetical protein
VMMRDTETMTDPVMELPEMVELLFSHADPPALDEYPAGKRS